MNGVHGGIDELRLIGIAGTNKVMAGELSRLCRRAFSDVRLPSPKKEGLGALVYPFDVRVAALAVQYHRTSSRVLWGLFRSRADRLEPLYEDLYAAMCAEKRPWFSEGKTISVESSRVGDFPAGGRQVVGVVKNAVIDGAARQGVRLAVDAESPDIHLDVRMHEGIVTVSLDLSGRPMNQRGYRGDRGLAPLRENLAAVLVMLARFDARNEVLLDPMAGSGTIPIEAVCMGQGMPVWVPPRRPAAARMEFFSGLFSEREQSLFGDTQPLVMANDWDPEICNKLRKNASAASVSQWIRSTNKDFEDLDPAVLNELLRRPGSDSRKGLILSNPPYGERIAPDQLLELYRRLGSWCRRFRGWRAGFLVANPAFEDAFGLRPRIKKPLSNGPLRGHFFLYEL